MLRQAVILAVLASIGTFLYSRFTAEDGQFLFQPIRGKNNTVLFVTNEHPGLCNVHLATVYSLLENHPDIEIHYASFPRVAKMLDQISVLAAERGSGAKDIKFHTLSGLGYVAALRQAKGTQENMTHPPGLAGARFLSNTMGAYIAPWTAEDYWILYESLSGVIDEVDPAVIVIDTVFGPGIDATRDKRRLHALVTPNILSDLTPAKQPAWTLLWKYPALASGLPYPIPWRQIPANIYMNIQIIRGVLSVPEVSAKKRYLLEKGIKRPIDFMGLYRPDVPWITQTLPGVHIPLVSMPRNVTLTGPINLAGLEEKTSAGQELLDWIKKPTVLISLGSGFRYSEENARSMLDAVQNVLKETDVQVLWKLDKLESFDGKFLETAMRESSGRLRIERWLGVAPPTILQNGNIVAFVHHGGAGSFHDSLG
jgi:hypothetical protein